MPPASRPWPLGVTVEQGGANVAVYSETADAVDVCLFDASGAEERIRLGNRTGYVFHDFVPGMLPGVRYGLRVDGPWDPTHGLRHNAQKLLLDPRARAIEGRYDWNPTVFAHRHDAPLQQELTDDAPSVPRCIVVDPQFDWADDRHPQTNLSETIVYEMHVKGFTKRMGDVPEPLRGTYAGLAHPKAIAYLKDLGVTAVELLPVHQFVHDQYLLEKKLTNYWGYNSIGFFAPHGEYASAGDAGGQVDEFKGMVKALHAADLEVILDVVYNHTAEGNHLGPSLSLKGIDNASHYRLVDGDEEHYFDTTGTGNSVNVGHPAALRLIMDSLRYWVQEMHVDGFRFDLATTLTRQDGDPDQHSAFLAIVHQDPVLRSVKLIAEPWDTHAYQVGGFPPEWSEWNGRYRDDVRAFWNLGEGVLGTFSQRFLGSPDVYESTRRSPLSSVNFVTAHDGFTLADLTAYAGKHNEANGEQNRDGSDDNRSDNSGVEGPTDDPAINARRLRQRKNFLATLLLSTGVPMLLGGDEIGRTQRGNNNAYCQDNKVSWFDWNHLDRELFDWTKRLIWLRRFEPSLRPAWFRHAPGGDTVNAVRMLRADGNEFTDADWNDAIERAILFEFVMDGRDTFAVLLNSADNGVEFTVPPAPFAEWQLELSSDPDQRVVAPVTTLIVRDRSITVLRSRGEGTPIVAPDEPRELSVPTNPDAQPVPIDHDTLPTGTHGIPIITPAPDGDGAPDGDDDGGVRG